MQFISKKLKENNISQEEFYQSKYDYYRLMSIWAVCISAVSNCFYWISDCQLFGRIAYETILARVFMTILVPVYLVLVHKFRTYKVAVVLSYLMLHGIMWCTIWAIYYLPIKQHANEGFIIMHLMFLALGFCAPIKKAMFWHSMLIADIIVSYSFNHYENIDLMMSLGIPTLIAIEFLLYLMENMYFEQYLLKSELQAMSYKDQLTGVYNRNKIQDICIPGTNQLINKNACVVIMDIDFFKRVNDTYGHNIGDEVLKSLASILQSNVDSSNSCIIRWGGEEFVIILEDCSLTEAKAISERIRKSVARYTDGACPITISLGVARATSRDLHTVIRDADEALYYAKEHGRNQVRVYTPDGIK